MTRLLISDLIEAVIAVGLLGVAVAGLYRLFVGEVPWTFFIGEFVGFLMGVGMLVASAPRRSRGR